MAFLNYDGLKRYDKKTKKYIKDKISEASLNGGTVDLSEYATKEELKNHTDDADLHITLAEKCFKAIIERDINLLPEIIYGDYNNLIVNMSKEIISNLNGVYKNIPKLKTKNNKVKSNTGHFKSSEVIISKLFSISFW